MPLYWICVAATWIIPPAENFFPGRKGTDATNLGWRVGGLVGTGERTTRGDAASSSGTCTSCMTVSIAEDGIHLCCLRIGPLSGRGRNRETLKKRDVGRAAAEGRGRDRRRRCGRRRAARQRAKE